MRPVFLAHARQRAGGGGVYRVCSAHVSRLTWQGSTVTSWARQGRALLSPANLPTPESPTHRFRPLRRGIRPKDCTTIGQGSLETRGASSRMVGDVCSNWVGHEPTWYCHSRFYHSCEDEHAGGIRQKLVPADTLHGKFSLLEVLMTSTQVQVHVGRLSTALVQQDFVQSERTERHLLRGYISAQVPFLFSEGDRRVRRHSRRQHATLVCFAGLLAPRCGPREHCSFSVDQQ